jgi:hypothetical protein
MTTPQLIERWSQFKIELEFPHNSLISDSPLHQVERGRG